MTTINKDEGGIAPDILFQILTLFVWIGALALLVLSVKHVRDWHFDLRRFVMPVIHLVPWCIAAVERRKVSKFLSNGAMPQDQLPLVLRTLTRILWSGYLTLSLVEYWFY
jgi:hypothetical protein